MCYVLRFDFCLVAGDFKYNTCNLFGVRLSSFFSIEVVIYLEYIMYVVPIVEALLAPWWS